jgi:hypothetical protein
MKGDPREINVLVHPVWNFGYTVIVIWYGIRWASGGATDISTDCMYCETVVGRGQFCTAPARETLGCTIVPGMKGLFSLRFTF